ncbi:hypothetical protein K2O51_31820 (plasmid) [Cupriavidus pinatubonensis]|uniref:hypothetical protein n=1 Tax=Cupriavidus pinatubonensis TaxID=248026 RepID=UPI001C72E72D|nr:hypothetical protein [Cupriavidus pinatubonensis]QYY33615.1 hypothetical protein K2O51_31820 [Cupriavidus pinatubonensis]
MEPNRQADMEYDLDAGAQFRFDPLTGPDAAFLPLLGSGGLALILELDELSVSGAREAAVRATMLYQRYASGEQRHQATRDLMDLFGKLLQADAAAGQAGPLITTLGETLSPATDRARQSGT